MNRRGFLAGLTALSAAPSPATKATATSGAVFEMGADEFVLTDVIAPSPGEPFAAESAAALAHILGLGRLDLVDRRERDRWNRRPVAVSVETHDGVRSVQELLIGAGGARVRPESEDRTSVEGLLRVEDAARRAERGLWALRSYSVRDAASHRGTGAFHIVEGRPVSAAVSKGRAFLNFGADYRTDMTATAATRDVRRWAKEGLDWEALAGRLLRVRGYVAWINGPSVEISHPMQIEFAGR